MCWRKKREDVGGKKVKKARQFECGKSVNFILMFLFGLKFVLFTIFTLDFIVVSYIEILLMGI